MVDIGPAGLDGVDLRWVDVETEDPDTRPGELEGEWKSDIAKTDY